MNNDNSQKIIDQKTIDEANLVKERLCNDSWDKIKNDKLFLKKVGSQSEDFDPIGIFQDRDRFAAGSRHPVEVAVKGGIAVFVGAAQVRSIRSGKMGWE